MSGHDKSSSSDNSWQKLAIPYDEFDVLVTDISEAELAELGHGNEIEHLGAGSFSSPAFLVSGNLVSGKIHGPNLRLMVPLVCQRAGKRTSRGINVWFLIDTGSPFTCLTIKSLEAIFGQGNAIYNSYTIAIQDQNSKIECQTSKAHFKEVNILGMNALLPLKVNIEAMNAYGKSFRLVKQ